MFNKRLIDISFYRHIGVVYDAVLLYIYIGIDARTACVMRELSGERVAARLPELRLSALSIGTIEPARLYAGQEENIGSAGARRCAKVGRSRFLNDEIRNSLGRIALYFRPILILGEIEKTDEHRPRAICICAGSRSRLDHKGMERLVGEKCTIRVSEEIRLEVSAAGTRS